MMTWIDWYNSPDKTDLDACALDHQPDLDDPLPDHPRQLRLRVCPGVSWQGAVASDSAVRRQSRGKPFELGKCVRSHGVSLAISLI